MANLIPSWQTCRVQGIWVTADRQGLRAGKYKVRFPRLRNIKQKAIVPAGLIDQGALSLDAGLPLPVADTDPIVGKSLNILVPATTDPDTRETFQATIEITFDDDITGANSETYVIDLPSGGTINLDDYQPSVVGKVTSTPAASLKIGLPGGLATLDGAGKVPLSQLPSGGIGGGIGTVVTINTESPDGAGNVTLSANDVGAVAKTGDESIDGIKTFTAKPVVPLDTWSLAMVQGLVAALTNRVRVDIASQGLTPTEKSNARINIGAMGAVYDPSSLVGLPDGTFIGYTV